MQADDDDGRREDREQQTGHAGPCGQGVLLGYGQILAGDRRGRIAVLLDHRLELVDLLRLVVQEARLLVDQPGVLVQGLDVLAVRGLVIEALGRRQDLQ
jgi:hypothetical protein